MLTTDAIFMVAQQQTLFDAEPSPWELDDQGQRYVATVVFSSGPSQEFDYLVPEGFRDPTRPESLVEPGRRVQVSWGNSNRMVVGYCIAVGYKPVGRPLKTLSRVLDEQSLLSPAMLRLTRWMADYYMCPLGQVLEAVVPAGVRQQAGTREVKLLTVPTEVSARITQLKLPQKQAEALRILAASTKPLSAQQLAARADCTVAPIKCLREKGLVQETLARVDHHAASDSNSPSVPRVAPHKLNQDQQAATDAILAVIHSRSYKTLLVHGVTGSGKTEVYMRAIDEVVRFGRQAIVLVPEISLTPQTVHRFRARFNRVAILHSHQSDVERHRHWRRIAQGEVEVVVGPRSAVFAPVPNLGLIVLDEEHESTFKQEIAPRYHARDVARWRAKEEQIPLVLGSATPSLESWHRAAHGDYQLLKMPWRIGKRPLPAVHTIDLRLEEHRRSSRGAISRPLHQAMEAALRDGGQVILLLNRRGFSTHMQCSACGHVVKCPNCGLPDSKLSLTFHRTHNAARCHFCDYEAATPTECPECHAEGIRFSGLGTQKLEAEVRARFAGFRCLRMDTDSMRRPGSHDDALAEFREGRAQILLGTQMIAKGLDFPNVTLVGIINADLALHLPDFRAAERTFQLVTQVAGRTGRGEKGGRVMMQTFSPDHPAIVAATRHDYSAFAAYELPCREMSSFPPFGSLVRIVLRSEEEAAVKLTADQYCQCLLGTVQKCSSAVRVLGPAPAPIARLRGAYRYHLLVQSTDLQEMREAIRRANQSIKLANGVTFTIDVDPVDML